MADGHTVSIKLETGSLLAERLDGVYLARGIPYATAQRFQRPVAAANWDGLKDCTKASAVPPQNPSRLDKLTGPLAAGRLQAEDCLLVTIAGPIQTLTEASVPVLVYIHGGAYMTGGGDLDAYSPVPLARRGLVVVNVSYRVGILGYSPFYEFGGANLGLFDQIAALEWVQNNIRHFGGDPERVTVYGESAGADSIYLLLGTTQSQGLFSRAILASAPFGMRKTDDDREQMTAAMADGVRQRLSDKMRSAPMEEVLEVQIEVLSLVSQYRAGMMPFGPMFGHAPLPGRSEFEKRVLERTRNMTVLLTRTGEEGNAFASDDPQRANQLTDKVFAEPLEEFAKELNGVAASCSVGIFDWAPRDSPFGAAHTLDLPLVVGKWDSWKQAPMLASPESQQVITELGSEVKDVIAAFAQLKDVKPQRLRFDIGFVCPPELRVSEVRGV